MASINFPFAASGPRRMPTSEELAEGYGCGDADLALFNGLAWWQTSEIANAIGKSGFTPDDTDPMRLARSMRRQSLNYVAIPGGTGNALTATLDPVPANYAELVSAPLRVKIATSNTGAATINVNALGVKSILTPAGNALVAGDLLAGTIVTLLYDGTNFQLSGVSGSTVIDAYIAGGRPAQNGRMLLAHSSGVQNAPDNTATVVTDWVADSSVLDDATFSGGVLTFGPRTAGVWAITANCGIAAPSTGYVQKTSLFKNVSTMIGYGESGDSGTSRTPFAPAMSVESFASGDTLRVSVTQNRGTAASLSQNSRLTAFRVGI